MYLHAALLQRLSDAKLADLRHEVHGRDRRASDLGHDLALRTVRPLRGRRAHR